jgi:RNA-directed DNA polymerase
MRPSPRRRLVAEALADAFLAGSIDKEALVDRGRECLGRKARWLSSLAGRIFQRFGTGLAGGDREKLIDYIATDPSYDSAWSASRPPSVRKYFLDPPRMAPRTGGLAAANLPALATPGDLAAWLEITPAELDWFADRRRLNHATGPLAHYTYRWIAKRHGARLVEVPKHRLREIQRKILSGILESVPVHHAAHGFRRGRSAITFAKAHIGRTVLLRMDLRGFFPGIPGARIHALFETLGYPVAVARILTALCANSVPMSVARQGAGTWEDAKRLAVPHLPQGAPTSPALANLCTLHLDLRLDGFAKSLGATYTRYADDLAVSGDDLLRRRVGTVSRWIACIALEEGFAINHRKTRIMHRSDRQVLCGIVVNDRPNIRRGEYDQLKAILTNCVRQGPGMQNRQGHRDFRSHLAGRVAWVASLNAERGARLEALLRRVDWAA